MRNLLLAIFTLLFFHTNIHAQANLIVEGASPNLFINHTVAPKENYYSVGRLYNVSPKELAPYNNLQFDKGLSLGQSLKIPLTANNFTQTGEAANDEALIPVYHTVQAKEGLYRVSVAYNKVPLDVLKKWNNLKSDAVSNGTKLIVGYLKVLKDQSAFAQKGVTVPVITKPKEIPDHTVSDIKILKTTPDQKTVPDKDVKQETKPGPTIKEPANNNAVNNNKPPSTNSGGGYFKKMYNDQALNKSSVFESGSAGVFKTTSGWQDGKYYCFHNTAPQGTIVKITNNVNGKSVYAKVLDAIPDIKQNSGLLLRLSNSAAEELGAGDNKFDCSISYSK